MAGKQWILGCGVGCLAVVVVVVIAGGIMVSKVKDAVSEFEDVGETQAELREQFGNIEDYVPPAAGQIDAQRLEIFLAVQQQIHEPAIELAKALEGVRAMEQDSGFSFSKIRGAFQGLGALGVSAGRYFSARNNALLEQEMGFGEFTYLTSLIYYGWLGNPLILTIDGDDDGDQRGRARRNASMFKGLLKRQRDAAREAGDPGELVAAIEEQLSELALDDEWVPWAEGGLPDSVASSLAPYRGRLEAVYADTGVMLGIGANDGDGGFNFEVH